MDPRASGGVPCVTRVSGTCVGPYMIVLVLVRFEFGLGLDDQNVILVTNVIGCCYSVSIVFRASTGPGGDRLISALSSQTHQSPSPKRNLYCQFPTAISNCLEKTYSELSETTSEATPEALSPSDTGTALSSRGSHAGVVKDAAT